LHFDVDHAELVRALKVAAGTCSRRPTLPVLGGVKIEAAGWGRPVTITTTDLELTSTTRLDSSLVVDTGAVVVPLRELAATLKGRQPKGTLARLELDQEAGLLRMHAGGLHAALHVNALEDYPTLRGEVSEGEVRVTSDLGLLGTWARRVLPATSGDEARPVLTAVQVKRDQGTLTATATDSYRLHTYQTEQLDDSAFCFLLPARALTLVKQAIALYKATEGGAWWHGTGTDTHGTGEVRVQVGPSMFWARAIEGEFPSTWERLIPTMTGDVPTIDVTDGAAAAAAIVASFGREPIILEASGATIAASCKRQDIGKVEAELPGLKLAGYTPFTPTSFKPLYLRELLAAVDHGTMQLRDSLKPALVTDGNGFRGLIMPVRIP
jgi:DNA polymerase-3 subunit beta